MKMSNDNKAIGFRSKPISNLVHSKKELESQKLFSFLSVNLL